MRCEQCGDEFEAARSTAKYCGAKCRVAANRAERRPFELTEGFHGVDRDSRFLGRHIRRYGEYRIMETDGTVRSPTPEEQEAADRAGIASLKEL